MTLTPKYRDAGFAFELSLYFNTGAVTESISVVENV
jgi:hypothetical protein